MQPPHADLVDDEEVKVTDGGAARFAAVDTKSGEEKYELLLELKGKLYRFDEGENQWKERGQGPARILRHKEQQHRHFFILRREGIGKLGAYHELVRGIKLQPYSGSDKAFVWTAPKDFSDDDEGYEEAFAIRFATKDMAAQFAACFNKIVA